MDLPNSDDGNLVAGMNDGATTCSSVAVCGGCPWIEVPHAEQVARKRANLVQQFENLGIEAGAVKAAEFLVPRWSRLRERVDLTLSGGVLGMIGGDKTGTVKLNGCTALAPELFKYYEEFSRDLPTLAHKGSVRLRVAPDGQRGVWLDLANVDAKSLLDDGAWLKRNLASQVIEIGQRRKRVKIGGGTADGARGADGLRLGEPELLRWTSTFAGGVEIPLYSTVGSFSQPGREGTKVLVREVERVVQTTKPRKTLELGAGIGTFTLPLAMGGMPTVAWEMDLLAIAGLAKSKLELGLSDSQLRVVTNRFDGDGFEELIATGDLDLILVDPPRSGLGGFVKKMLEVTANLLPSNFLYVSCYGESLARDMTGLLAAGYKTRRVTFVDQFPQTPHCEYVVWLSL